MLRLQFDLFYCRSRTPPHSAMATRCAGNSSNLTSDALSGDGAHLTSDTAASEGAHAQPLAMLPALPSSSLPSGDLHPADSPNPDVPAKSKAIDATGNTASSRKVALASDTEHGGAMLPGGFVYQGRWYRGVAASNPIFLPPENFFIPQPQLWSQCACERILHEMRLRRRRIL